MASGYPQFDGFSLQDDNYIVQDVVYRTIPNRSLDTEKLARRPGVKTLSTDFSERKVTLAGVIIADSVSTLRTAIDNFHANVTRKNTGALYIESDRSANAIVSSVSIADPHYSQSIVPFNIEFLLSDPFYYGQQQLVTFTVPSGTTTMSQSITISGSVFAEPYFQYTAPGTAGAYTTTSGIQIKYGPTSEVVTWSGTQGHTTAGYGDIILFDYPNHQILQNSNKVDIDGVFARWEPVQTAFTITFSGTAQGGTMQVSYQPRYL